MRQRLFAGFITGAACLGLAGFVGCGAEGDAEESITKGATWRSSKKKTLMGTIWVKRSWEPARSSTASGLPDRAEAHPSTA